MSKSCKTHFFLQGSQPQPNIRIIQCGYTAVPDWSHPNVNSPFWYLWRNCETGSTVISGDDCFELGPDHYLPFIAIGKSRGYGLKKTLLLTLVCGIGHIVSALLIALVFIYFSQWLSAENFAWIEENRGEG